MKVTRPQRWFQCTRKALSFKKASVTDSEDIQSPTLRLGFARLTKVDSMDPEALFNLAVFLVTAVRMRAGGELELELNAAKGR